MLMPTIITAALALILVLIGYSKGQHITGIKQALTMTMQILPLLIFAFIIAGMVQVLIPHEAISKWIGEGSGIKGILIGTAAGAITPDGPYVSLPIVLGLVRSGASMGIMVAYITSWSLLGITRLPMEIGILGVRFALIRIISVIVLAPIAGIFAQYLSKIIK